jgi:hypothetical protein
MHCTQCGNQIGDDARFCDSCGAPALLARAAVASAEVQPERPAPAVQPAKKACPYCGEEILAVATRCRFCNSDLSLPVTPHTGSSVIVQGPQASSTPPSIVIQNVQTHQGPSLGAIRDFKNPGVALLLSVIFPGGGQFYNGHAGKGIIVLFTFWLIIPYFWSWFDAYNSAKRINRVGF